VSEHEDTAWFEELYADAEAGRREVPWDRGGPNPFLEQWVKPIQTLIEQYVRLSSRGIRSAEQELSKIEAEINQRNQTRTPYEFLLPSKIPRSINI